MIDLQERPAGEQLTVKANDYLTVTKGHLSDSVV